MKAAEVYSREEENIFICGQMDVSSKRIDRAFSLDAAKVFSACMPSGPKWSVGNDLMANIRDGYLTSKVVCLVEILLRYRENKDLRCIVFVERIVTAIVIRNLLNELLLEVTGWRTEYTAGNNSILQPQSRKEQNVIVDKFRKGTVNIIIATSMLEEGLDVQSCKLVIRFDPSATICSFIQSRGRARMQNSEFIIMVESEDSSALSRVKNFLASGDIMRRECMSHADLPCEPLEKDLYDKLLYRVTSTGAIVNLSSSVQLLYVYCSRLPSDGYFKPYPRFTIEQQTCTIHLPNSCPIRTITVQGDKKILKQLACLEACKQLHQHGALSDNLVPDIVEEETEAQDSGNEPYLDEHAKYFPQELVGLCVNGSNVQYQFYLLELQPGFQYDVKFQDILLAVHTKLDDDLENLDLELDADRGKLIIRIKHIGCSELNSEQVALCQRFQNTVFRVLLDHNLDKIHENLNQYSQGKGSYVFNYIFLPALRSQESVTVDWNCITGVHYPKKVSSGKNSCRFSARGHGHYMLTKNSMVCLCMLENSLVCTPHNDMLYCIDGTLQDFDGNTLLELGEGEMVTYKQYYQQRHGIKLQYERQTLLKAKRVFTVHNYLDRSRIPSSKEPRNRTCELPPELCSIIMAPISVSTFYSFSFLPSVMHRIESLLIAANLKSMHADHCTQNVVIPTIVVLEAITTKKCQENIHLESLETLGDSFLKYAASQQLFKTYQNRHEGLLSLKRKKIISNPALCKLGCDRNITGFIRNEQFDPKTWIIPGTNCADRILKEEMLSSSKKVYIEGIKKIKQKTVADVVEALIGAYLSVGGEIAALSFMAWLGIRVDLEHVPYTRKFAVKPEMYVNVRKIESLLKYSFRDATLLVEALTHGSYMLPEIPGCYQRLEFLGDAVLDYLITLDLFDKYPHLSPGLLTDLRSMSVNNDCYGQSAIKWELHKHILYSSTELLQQIRRAVHSFEESPSTFAWESETFFPKVLGDVIESLAGAIFVDSGYNKDIVFKSMRRLLEPLVTLETLKLHPVRELTELCQRGQYSLKKTVFSSQNGVMYYMVEVEACGVVHKETQSVTDKNKKTAERLACKAVLKRLKESMSVKPTRSLA
ncbi:Ribonuclease [Handroanthus impetiginosus]|uniref:Ribonuclease n=1 Tax=Handroanthus impetiginosus TaxID=429701 RepID=A0A2G9HVV2_9LAMI|nr:Ribonuclease [Handroanthus impetiginosus]